MTVGTVTTLERFVACDVDDVEARPSVSVVVPCYNEAANLPRACQEITSEFRRYPDVELILVDDGSTDETLALIKALALADSRIKYLSFSRNYGQEAAFSAGFKYASKRWTVQLDADLQSPPADAHELLATALDEGYDAVFSTRRHRDDPLVRRLTSRLHNWLATRIFGIEMPRGAWGFRVVRTSVAKKAVSLGLAQPYFLATLPLLGARYTTVTTSHRARQDGRPRWTLRRLLAHAVDLFVGFSYRLVTFTSVVAALACLATAALIGLAAAGRIQPLTMAGAGVAISATSLMSIAIVGRYVVRAVRGQAGLPQYCIRESNIAVDPADELYEHERVLGLVGSRPERVAR